MGNNLPVPVNRLGIILDQNGDPIKPWVGQSPKQDYDPDKEIYDTPYYGSDTVNGLNPLERFQEAIKAGATITHYFRENGRDCVVEMGPTETQLYAACQTLKERDKFVRGKFLEQYKAQAKKAYDKLQECGGNISLLEAHEEAILRECRAIITIPKENLRENLKPLTGVEFRESPFATTTQTEGGAASGDHGHAGRPGARGGSTPSGNGVGDHVWFVSGADENNLHHGVIQQIGQDHSIIKGPDEGNLGQETSFTVPNESVLSTYEPGIAFGMATEGGPSSGDRGHSGRPGARGGSTPGGIMGPKSSGDDSRPLTWKDYYKQNPSAKMGYEFKIDRSKGPVPSDKAIKTYDLLNPTRDHIFNYIIHSKSDKYDVGKQGIDQGRVGRIKNLVSQMPRYAVSNALFPESGKSMTEQNLRESAIRFIDMIVAEGSSRLGGREQTKEGAAGSGDFAHAGRPGQRGGSSLASRAAAELASAAKKYGDYGRGGSYASHAATQASEEIARQGGTSVSIVTGKSPTNGFMVSMAGTEHSFPEQSASSTREKIRDYITEHFSALGMPDMYLGGWNFKGKTYVDVSENFKGPRAKALELGRSRDQIAIYDVSKGQSVNTMSDGERPSESKGEPIREADKKIKKVFIKVNPGDDPGAIADAMVKALGIK